MQTISTVTMALLFNCNHIGLMNAVRRRLPDHETYASRYDDNGKSKKCFLLTKDLSEYVIAGMVPFCKDALAIWWDKQPAQENRIQWKSGVTDFLLAGDWQFPVTVVDCDVDYVCDNAEEFKGVVRLLQNKEKPDAEHIRSACEAMEEHCKLLKQDNYDAKATDWRMAALDKAIDTVEQLNDRQPEAMIAYWRDKFGEAMSYLSTLSDDNAQLLEKQLDLTQEINRLLSNEYEMLASIKAMHESDARLLEKLTSEQSKNEALNDEVSRKSDYIKQLMAVLEETENELYDFFPTIAEMALHNDCDESKFNPELLDLCVKGMGCHFDEENDLPHAYSLKIWMLCYPDAKLAI